LARPVFDEFENLGVGTAVAATEILLGSRAEQGWSEPQAGAQGSGYFLFQAPCGDNTQAAADYRRGLRSSFFG